MCQYRAVGALVVLVAAQLSAPGIVSPAGVQKIGAVISAPDDHFIVRSRLPCVLTWRRARWWCWWLSSYRCWDCICRRCQKTSGTPLFNRRQSCHCRSTLLCDQLGHWARWWCWWLSSYRCWDCIVRQYSNRQCCRPPQTIISLPVHTAVCEFRAAGALVVLVAVQLSVLGLYLPPVLKSVGNAAAPPRRSFHCQSSCRVSGPAGGGVSGASSCPTVGAGIVFAAGVRVNNGVDNSSPDDHFTASPNSRV